MIPREAEPPRRLGVGICALDEEAALARLLPRLVGDGPDGADLVVVADGGSSDRTREVVRAHGCTLAEGVRGRGAQLALAGDRLLAGGCDVLLFLHADSLPDAGALAALRTAYADGALVAAGMQQRIEAAGRAYRWIEAAADARVRRGMVFGDSALSVRAADYVAVGGFEALPLFEDVRLSARLRRRGPTRLLEGARVRVSPRRWKEEGILRCTLRNWILRVMHSLGVPPARLSRLYRNTGRKGRR